MKTQSSTQKTDGITNKMMENADRYLMLRLQLDLFKHRQALNKNDIKDYPIDKDNPGIPAAS